MWYLQFVYQNLYFTLKSVQNKTFKHEWIMNKTFFSEGKVGDIKWVLTNEKKTIAGLNCLKAITKKGNYPMLTVWYTKEIPVSNGPSIYQGLPGLVVWSEDYFRTIQISDIKYNNDLEHFNKLYKTKYKTFEEQKKRRKYYDKEPILIIKKGDLANNNYEYHYGKPFKR